MRDTDERIACTTCGRRIVPRLWHYGGGRLSYMRTQHLCPFCGTVIYESGGGVRWGCVAPALAFLVLAGWLFILITYLRLRL